MPTIFDNLIHRYIQHRLIRAIKKNDLRGVEWAISRGAPMAGWKAKSPSHLVDYMVHGPGLSIRFPAHDAITLAVEWSASNDIIEHLLAAGARVPDNMMPQNGACEGEFWVKLERRRNFDGRESRKMVADAKKRLKNWLTAEGIRQATDRKTAISAGQRSAVNRL